MKVVFQRDSIDLEELKDMLRSPGYALLTAKHDAMLESFRQTLEQATTFEEVRFLQGQIDCLKCVQKLPQILHDEIRAKQRRLDPL